MCCFRSSYYLALCLLDSDICALACPEVCVPEVCVHSSENDTDLSKKDVKWGQNRRNKAGEAVCEFYRIGRFLLGNMKQRHQKSIFTNYFWFLIDLRPQRPVETLSKQPKVQQSITCSLRFTYNINIFFEQIKTLSLNEWLGL